MSLYLYNSYIYIRVRKSKLSAAFVSFTHSLDVGKKLSEQYLGTSCQASYNCLLHPFLLSLILCQVFCLASAFCYNWLGCPLHTKTLDSDNTHTLGSWLGVDHSTQFDTQ